MSHARTLEVLDRLVGFRSVFTADDYVAIADFCIDYLAGLGFAVHRLTGPRAGRAGLFASLGPAGPGGVLLSAHLDVVPVEGQSWSSDPFRLTRRGRRLYGRGTTDMKGFAAAALAAAARAAEAPLAAPLKIALSYDEEAGCVGMAEMIGALEHTIGLPDFCIVGEPTSMQLAIGHKGKDSWRIRFHGAAGHSASAPRYANALYMASDAISVLRGVQQDLAAHGLRDDAYDIPYTTVHVGTLSGGTALNIVPDHAELEFEIRYLAAEPVTALTERIASELGAIVLRVRALSPAAAAVMETINRYPGLETRPSSRVVALASALGGRSPLTKVSYGTEAGFFNDRWGIPTIVCGPGDMAQGHKPDEFIGESELAACDAMLTALVERLRSGAPYPAFS